MNIFTFQDYYKNEVQLTFNDHGFISDPRHVLVICRYKEQWLLTRHSRRGLEFPGGKVEAGELPDDAAVREVWEETGAGLASIEWLGQYKVTGKAEVIYKNVYFARVEEIIPKEDYMETLGPVLCRELPADLKNNASFSFLMRDDVIPYCLTELKQRNWT